MGLCGSSQTAEDIKNKNIEKAQNSELKKQDEIIKLLLLGAGESGKSTIFRQMKLLYGKAFTEEELRNMIPVVHANVLSNFLLVLNNAAPKGIVIGPAELADRFMQTVDEESVIDEAMAADIKTLWADPGVQRVWSERSTFQVLDSLEHYLQPETIDKISAKDYVPTEADILHARVRTSGIVEEQYVIDGVAFTMFDVGGQRNERKKWIHAFDGVTAAIFAAALNQYHLVLYEDNRTARMAESVKLFDEIANSQWFSKTSIILFLNKVDLFIAKLWRVPYRVEGVRNDEFEGPFAEDYGERDDKRDEIIQAAIKHSLDKFLAVKRSDEKEIYHHVTCATDSKNIQVVFNACKDIILRSNLVESGFMQ